MRWYPIPLVLLGILIIGGVAFYISDAETALKVALVAGFFGILAASIPAFVNYLTTTSATQFDLLGKNLQGKLDICMMGFSNDMQKIHEHIGGVKTDVGAIKVDINGVKNDVQKISSRMDDLEVFDTTQMNRERKLRSLLLNSTPYFQNECVKDFAIKAGEDFITYAMGILQYKWPDVRVNYVLNKGRQVKMDIQVFGEQHLDAHFIALLCPRMTLPMENFQAGLVKLGEETINDRMEGVFLLCYTFLRELLEQTNRAGTEWQNQSNSTPVCHPTPLHAAE